LELFANKKTAHTDTDHANQIPVRTSAVSTKYTAQKEMAKNKKITSLLLNFNRKISNQYLS
jgi:hypothetical protein